MNKLLLSMGLVFVLLFSGCSNVATIGLPTLHGGSTIVVEDYRYAVAAGEANSATIWNKFGYNEDIDIATSPELVASFGGTAEDIFLSSAEILNISSSDSRDVSGSSGAYSIIITGIDNNWAEIVDVISLNGTNVVQTNLAFRGVNRMAIFQSGSHLANWGTISAIASSNTTTQAQIPADSGTTQQALLYVETNHTFLTTDLVVNANKLGGGSSPKITIFGYVEVPLTNARYEVFRKTIDTSVENTFLYQPTMPFIVGEEQILYFVATTDTNNALVNLRFSGILKEND